MNYLRLEKRVRIVHYVVEFMSQTASELVEKKARENHAFAKEGLCRHHARHFGFWPWFKLIALIWHIRCQIYHYQSQYLHEDMKLCQQALDSFTKQDYTKAREILVKIHFQLKKGQAISCPEFSGADTAFETICFETPETEELEELIRVI